ncbi:MAG: hypothetical protein LBR23_10210 [Spirochaetaceae bacterium]|jgi:hypothetical protein|nr:hypothetical protein [Spirochaetaceae bacterium]
MDIEIRYKSSAFLFLALLAGLCAAPIAPGDFVHEVDADAALTSAVTENRPYYLGMTFDELMEMDLYNTPFQITAQYPVEGGPDAGGRAVWMSETCLLFNASGILYSIEDGDTGGSGTLSQ